MDMRGWRPLAAMVSLMLLAGGSGVAGDEPPVSALSAGGAAAVAAPAAAPRSVEELVEEIKRSVVVVEFRGRDGERQGLGSGVIIDSSGLIATNLHVIGEARPIVVRLHDGRQLDVDAVHATDRIQDLAILQVKAEGLASLPLGNSDTLRDGQPVLAMGNPLGLERSVVRGVLSGRRTIDDRELLQLASPIERGNSGGPLVDLDGRVHGLLTLKSLQTANLGFAVPSKAITTLLQHPNPIPMSRWLTIGVLDPEAWTVLPGGRWRQRAGRIHSEGRGSGIGARALILSRQPAPELPFEVAVQVKLAAVDGAAGIVFHCDGGNRHYGFYPSNGELRLSRFDGPDVYAWNVLHQVRSPHLRADDWNLLKVRVEPGKIQCYVNGHLVIESADEVYRSGSFGLCRFRQTEAEFKAFRLGTSLETSAQSLEAEENFKRELATWLALGANPQDDFPAQLAAQPGHDAELFEDEARKLEDQARRLRQLSAEIERRKAIVDLSGIAADTGEIDMLKGALLIARIDNPDLDVDEYYQTVERMAQRISKNWTAETSLEDRVAGLHRYMFDEQGYHGSRTDYHNRSNSYLNEVIDDREGMPITLAVLYLEVAKRVGLKGAGIGLPGHFLVRLETTDAGGRLIDVFDRGQTVTREQARQRAAEYSDLPWEERFLQPMESRAILVRMLRNLFHGAREAEDSERMFRYSDAIVALLPDSVQDRFFRAVLALQTRRLNQSRLDVDWLQERTSGELDPEAIRSLAVALSREEARKSEFPARISR